MSLKTLLVLAMVACVPAAAHAHKAAFVIDGPSKDDANVALAVVDFFAANRVEVIDRGAAMAARISVGAKVLDDAAIEGLRQTLDVTWFVLIETFAPPGGEVALKIVVGDPASVGRRYAMAAPAAVAARVTELLPQLFVMPKDPEPAPPPPVEVVAVPPTPPASVTRKPARARTPAHGARSAVLATRVRRPRRATGAAAFMYSDDAGKGGSLRLDIGLNESRTVAISLEGAVIGQRFWDSDATSSGMNVMMPACLAVVLPLDKNKGSRLFVRAGAVPRWVKIEVTGLGEDSAWTMLGTFGAALRLGGRKVAFWIAGDTYFRDANRHFEVVSVGFSL